MIDFEAIKPQDKEKVYGNMTYDAIQQRVEEASDSLIRDVNQINSIPLVDAAQFFNFLVMHEIDITGDNFSKTSENWKNFMDHYNQENLTEEEFITKVQEKICLPLIVAHPCADSSQLINRTIKKRSTSN